MREAPDVSAYSFSVKGFLVGIPVSRMVLAMQMTIWTAEKKVASIMNTIIAKLGELKFFIQF